VAQAVPARAVREAPRVRAASVAVREAPHVRAASVAVREAPHVRAASVAVREAHRIPVGSGDPSAVSVRHLRLGQRHPPASGAAIDQRRRSRPAPSPRSKNAEIGAGMEGSTKTSAPSSLAEGPTPSWSPSDVETAGSADARDDDDLVIRLRIVVPRECDGWRLDHFLKRRIGRLSRTRIQRIIATQIELNGRRPRPATAVRHGETIFLERPAPVEPDVPRTFEVLYADEAVLVIDKPAGLPMHTSAKFWRNTLVAVLRERYPAQHTEICHRIDRETSGVMLIARTPLAGSLLKGAFAARKIAKRYLALVKGCPPDEGIIDQPLKLLETPTHLMMGPADDGLPATTRFRVVRRFAAHALVAASPETGRQHQIRVHLASLGHPLVGDKLYGAGEQYFMEACDTGISSDLLARFDGLARHALHAERLTFPHPVSGKSVTVSSPLPADLVGYMSALA
jgi:23S rRNA pseudouridine1911/1915/1917 synthase